MTKTPESLQEDFPPLTRQQWRARVEQDLKGKPFAKHLVTQADQGIELQPLYTQEDWPGQHDPGGFAGLRSMRRGTNPVGQSHTGIDIRLRTHEHSPADAGNALVEGHSRGATSVLLRLDRAAHSGIWSTPPPQPAHGTALRQPHDWSAALGEVRIHEITLALEAGASGIEAAAALVAHLRARKTPNTEIRALLGLDPIGVLARYGTYPEALDDAVARAAAVARWACAQPGHIRSMQVNTSPYHHAGADEAQDLAFAMATGVEYLRALEDSGLSVEEAMAQIAFHFRVGCRFFVSIARARAARVLWARIGEVCGASQRARAIYSTVSPSVRVWTRRDPWVNMLRNTACNFAALVGGADAVISAPFDLLVQAPDGLSRRVARNTPLILAQESHLHQTADPAGGSWFLETLTDELAAKAWELFQQIETQGGMRKVLQNGWVHTQINAVHEKRSSAIARRKQPITGVSVFPNLAESNIARTAHENTATHTLSQEYPPPVLPEPSREPIAYFETLIRAASQTPIDAMHAWSRSKTDEILSHKLELRTFAAPFENMRDQSDTSLAQKGARPVVFSANLGPIAHHTARATFARNLLEAGGFHTAANEGFTTPEDVAAAFSNAHTDLAVICGSDKTYQHLAVSTAQALAKAGARQILLAGRPGDLEQDLRSAGMTDFLYFGCDALALLERLWAHVTKEA